MFNKRYAGLLLGATLLPFGCSDKTEEQRENQPTIQIQASAPQRYTIFHSTVGGIDYDTFRDEFGYEFAQFRVGPDGPEEYVAGAKHPLNIYDLVPGKYKAVMKQWIDEHGTRLPRLDSEERLAQVMDDEGELIVGKPRTREDAVDIFFTDVYRGRLRFDGSYTTARIINVQALAIEEGEYIITPRGFEPNVIAPLEPYMKMLKEHGDPLALARRFEGFQIEFASFPVDGTEEAAKILVRELQEKGIIDQIKAKKKKE